MKSMIIVIIVVKSTLLGQLKVCLHFIRINYMATGVNQLQPGFHMSSVN